jgi:hypothetical protein
MAPARSFGDRALNIQQLQVVPCNSQGNVEERHFMAAGAIMTPKVSTSTEQ